VLVELVIEEFEEFAEQWDVIIEGLREVIQREFLGEVEQGIDEGEDGEVSAQGGSWVKEYLDELPQEFGVVGEVVEDIRHLYRILSVLVLHECQVNGVHYPVPVQHSTHEAVTVGLHHEFYLEHECVEDLVVLGEVKLVLLVDERCSGEGRESMSRREAV
jgi:hypothetical protein